MIDTGIKELKFYQESSINEFAGADGYAWTMLFSKELVKKFEKDLI